MRTRNPNRDVDEVFLSTVHKWIKESGEVFVVLRYLAAGGSRDYAIVETIDSVADLITILSDGTDIVVFKNRQLPLRGVVTDNFISQAKDMISNGDEFLLVRMEPDSENDNRLWGCMGDTHEDMLSDLADHQGQSIAFGLCPPFHEADNESMISRSKGGIDGPR